MTNKIGFPASVAVLYYRQLTNYRL